MYHDQGLAPFKSQFGLIGLNISIGLPFLRLSVDHGTAFELYGKNKANSSGMLYLLKNRLRFIVSINEITIVKAAVHNLKDVSISIPKNTLTVITGPSGSGKSSLAFDTVYVEGQRRYIESLSSYARQFLGQYQPPEVESITGLSLQLLLIKNL